MRDKLKEREVKKAKLRKDFKDEVVLSDKEEDVNLSENSFHCWGGS